MSSAKKRRLLKVTPTTRPELANCYERLYEELIKEYPKSTALQMTGDRFGGVCRQTIMYHIFPEYKENQKKQPSKKWAYEKQHPKIRKRVIKYKAKYMAARNHIGEIVKESYDRTSQQGMTLENLAYAVQDVSEILFKPKTLLGLSERHATQKGYPILVEVPGHKIPHYKLSEEAQKKY